MPAGLASEPLQLSLGATFAALAREYSAGDQMGLDVEHIVDGGKRPPERERPELLFAVLHDDECQPS